MADIQISDKTYFSQYISIDHFISYFHQLDILTSLNCSSILEIGIGNKIVSDFLTRAGYKITSCDFDQRLAPDVVANIQKLPFKDSAFDAVAAFEVIEHVPFEEIEEVLAELFRITNKHVIISIPYQTLYLNGALRLSFGRWRKLLTGILQIPYFWIKIKWNPQKRYYWEHLEHHWEMGRRGYPKRRIRKLLKKYFEIEKEFQAVLNPYHYFFVLKKHK